MGETCEVANAKIKLLRHLMGISYSLTKGRTDDAFLLRFLRAKKFDVDKAHRMVSLFLNF